MRTITNDTGRRLSASMILVGALVLTSVIGCLRPSLSVESTTKTPKSDSDATERITGDTPTSAAAKDKVETPKEAVDVAVQESEESLPDVAEETAADSVASDRATLVAAKDGSEADSEAGSKALLPGSLEAVFPMTPDSSPMWGDGPSRSMHNRHAKNIPHEWDVTTGKNILWRAPLGSQSYGNPVILNGKIFVGTNNDAERNPSIKKDKGVVMCIRQSDGKLLWQAVHDKLPQGRVNDWPEQGVCSTGVAQNGKYYYVSNRCEIICADVEGFTDGENDGPFKDEKYTSPIDGDFIWVLDMLNDYGVFPHNLATCSPIIVDDILYVVTANGVERDHITIPNPRAPSFIAVDKNTGEFLWGSRAPGEGILHGQWSNPTYGIVGGEPQVLFPGGDGWLYSFKHQREDAELLWKFDLNPKNSKWELGGLGTRNNIIATATMVGSVVYLAVGQDPEHGEGIGHLYAIDATGAKGGADITATAAKWHYGGDDFRRTISTVAIADGLLYAVDLSGFLHCLDVKTGKPYWVHDTLAAVWGSPTVIDDKVFLGDEDGDLVILEHGKKMKLLFETNMENAVYTTPVAVGETLYIANRTTLFAIRKGANTPPADGDSSAEK
jgi:outer membrane protein assembly factor BamB